MENKRAKNRLAAIRQELRNELIQLTKLRSRLLGARAELNAISADQESAYKRIAYLIREGLKSAKELGQDNSEEWEDAINQLENRKAEN